MTEYYVSTAGNNTNDGLGPSASRAWKTIQYSVNQLGAGDILYCRSGTYRERVYYNGDTGTEEDPILITDYGDGDVNLYAERDGLGSWTLYSGQIYTVDYPTESMTPKGSEVTCLGIHNIIVDSVPLLPKLTLPEVVAGSFYYDSTADKIYVWCAEGGSPSGRAVGIQETYNDSYGSYMHGLMIYGSSGYSWITVQNINVRYAPNKGIWIRGSNNTVKSVNAYFNQRHGILVGGSTTLKTYNLVDDCEVYFNVMENFPRGRFNNGYGGWSGGLATFNTYHTTVRNCKIWKNHGEGLSNIVDVTDKDTYINFCDNEVYDNYSENIYQNHGTHLIAERNFVYMSGAPTYSETWEYLAENIAGTKKRCMAMGIGTADEESPGSTDYTIIRNNILIGNRTGIHNYNHATGYGFKRWHVLNNTIIMPDATDYETNGCKGIALNYGYGNNEDIQVINNIIYSPHATSDLLYCDTDPEEIQELFYQINCNSNNIYAPNNSTPIKWGPGTERYSHADWLSLAGSSHGIGDITTNPSLKNITAISDITKRVSSGTSPVVNSGSEHTEITNDYARVPRTEGISPDIGAYEYDDPTDETEVIDEDWESNHGSAPYILTSNKTYILAKDITTDGTSFVVGNQEVILDINGYKVTYCNQTPVTIPNGDFETTDFTGWDFSLAPSFSRVEASPYAHGSWMLQGAIVTPESFVTPSFAPTKYPYEYCAWCQARGTNSSDSVTMELLLASDNTVLRSVTRTNANRGFSPILSHKITNGDNLKIRITCTPSGASTFWIDWLQFLFSRDYGIYASKTNYVTSDDTGYGETYYISGVPIQLWSISGFSSRTLPTNFSLIDSTHTHSPLLPGTGLITSGTGLPREGYALNCNTNTSMDCFVDGVSMMATGIDGGSILANDTTRLEVTNSNLECDIPAISNRMHTGYNIRKIGGSILLEDSILLNNPNYGIGLKDAPGSVASSISRNTITQRGIVTERYAIVLGQASNVNIIGNTIDVSNGGSGRGIMIDDDSSGHLGNMQDIRISGNNITVEEKQNLEYGITGLEVPGIRIRLKGTMGRFHNIEIDNNTIHAETGASDDHVHGAFGIRILIRNPSGLVDNSNLFIHDNDITALCSRAPGTSSYQAAAIAIDRMDANTWPLIYNNDLESNDCSFRLGTGDGYNSTLRDFYSESNTHIKSSSYTGLFTHQSIGAGWSGAGTTRPTAGAFILDPRYSGGAPSTWTWVDSGWTTGQTAEIISGWILTIQGNIPYETITITDVLSVLRYSGLAGSDGNLSYVPGCVTIHTHTKNQSGDTDTTLTPLVVSYGTATQSVTPVANTIVTFGGPTPDKLVFILKV